MHRIVNNTCSFEAFKGESCVVWSPFVELTEFEAAWLVDSGGVATPKAVWCGSREQLEAAKNQLGWIRCFTIIEIFGISSCPRIGDIIQIIKDGFVAVDKVIVHLYQHYCRIASCGEPETRTHRASVPETEAKIEVSFEFGHAHRKLLGEQSIQDKT